jgi:hypothetical protein
MEIGCEVVNWIHLANYESSLCNSNYSVKSSQCKMDGIKKCRHIVRAVGYCMYVL